MTLNRWPSSVIMFLAFAASLVFWPQQPLAPLTLASFLPHGLWAWWSLTRGGRFSWVWPLLVSALLWRVMPLPWLTALILSLYVLMPGLRALRQRDDYTLSSPYALWRLLMVLLGYVAVLKPGWRWRYSCRSRTPIIRPCSGCCKPGARWPGPDAVAAAALLAQPAARLPTAGAGADCAGDHRGLGGAGFQQYARPGALADHAVSHAVVGGVPWRVAGNQPDQPADNHHAVAVWPASASGGIGWHR
ncbi:hypothetical protein [Paludibacterium denitrificans]|uniref:hypothetical protein n=1 Tax=Paludibacterium denitrificans TaxID=2675226 RepID=UPI001E586E11|nr:hypothetical protein [Paludibacterium denitrificans]